MGRKRKNGDQDEKSLKIIILVTAILNLVQALISLIKKLIE